MVMLPRIQAERNLEAVRVAQVAGGQFEKGSKGEGAAQQTLEDWEAVVDGRDTKVDQKKRSKDERRKTRIMLFDIGVKKVTKETPDGKS